LAVKGRGYQNLLATVLALDMVQPEHRTFEARIQFAPGSDDTITTIAVKVNVR